MSDQKPQETPKPKDAPAASPAKQATPPVKPAAKDPSAPVGEPWESELLTSLRAAFPELAMEGYSHLGENCLIVPRESILPLTQHLKDECGYDMLSSLTASDYPSRDQRFDVMYQLYSFKANERLRVKIYVSEQETIESVFPVWSGADWMEREVFDMFGIRFDHHPNLKRILLPEEWEGHPLRKDYSILKQDQNWVKENLHIESGQ